MGHIQRERLPKSKMASSDDRFMLEIGYIIHVRMPYMHPGIYVHFLVRQCCVLETSLTRNFAADLYLNKSSTIARSLGIKV